MTDYDLYYWPIPFRGHFIRYVLAEAGATWSEPDFDAVSSLKNLAPQDQPYPFMAPPVLHERSNDRWLSQMQAILLHLGQRFDLTHDAGPEMRLACDASDILFEITCGHGARMWQPPDWAAFIGTRLPRWMQLHQRIVTDAGVTPGQGYLNGQNAPGLGDLILSALWHTMAECLPRMRPLLRANAPAVEGLARRVAERPPIATMLARWQDRSPQYCGGQIEESILDMLCREGSF